MTVFNLSKQNKFILFGETEEREVLDYELQNYARKTFYDKRRNNTSSTRI